MEEYVYEPIIANERAFRLILLHPGSRPQITIEIVHASFDEECLMPYEAVSYVWGPSEMCASVSVQEDKISRPESKLGHHSESVPETFLNVTNSVELVLRDLRLLDTKRCLWIDGVCINQIDQNDQQSKEKNHQVKLMDRIYNRAERVLLHLGRPTDMTPILKYTIDQLAAHQDMQKRPDIQRVEGLGREAEQKLQELEEEVRNIDGRQGLSKPQQPQKTRSRRKSEISDSDWEQVSRSLAQHHTAFHRRLRQSMECVLAQPWFKRVWIIQEVANSRRALIHWGPTSFSVRWFVDLSWRLDVDMDAHQEAILDMMPRRRRGKLDLSSGQDLYDLLVRFRETQASRDHDKIFALLGLCKPGKGLGTIAIDYSQSLDCLIRDTIAYIAYCDRRDVPAELTSMHRFMTGITSLLEDLVVHFAFQSKVTSLRSLLLNRGNQIIVPIRTLEEACSEGKDVVADLLLAHCTHKYPAMAKWTKATISMGYVPSAETETHEFTISQWFSLDPGIAIRLVLSLAPGLAYHLAARLALGLASCIALGLAYLLALRLAHGTRMLMDKEVDEDSTFPMILRRPNGKPRFTQLGGAVIAGEVEDIRQLLDEGASVNAKGPRNLTPLILAAAYGKQEFIAILLDHGADIEATDLDGRTALALAVERGHVDSAKVLLDCNAKVETKDKNGRTPLSMAASGGSNDVLSLGHSSSGNQIVEGRMKQRSRRRRNFGADTMNKFQLKIKRKGAKIDEKYSVVLQLLLDNGAEIDSVDNAHLTSLWWAINHGHQFAVEKLIESGADVEGDFVDNLSILSWTIWNGYRDLIAQLLPNIALNASTTNEALEWTARAGNTSLLKEFLDRRATAYNEFGSVLLLFLVVMKELNIAVLYVLLQHYVLKLVHGIKDILFILVGWL